MGDHDLLYLLRDIIYCNKMYKIGEIIAQLN